jgi:hypothetical protein
MMLSAPAAVPMSSNHIFVAAVTHALGLRHKTGCGDSDRDHRDNHSGWLHCVSSFIVTGARLSARRRLLA